MTSLLVMLLALMSELSWARKLSQLDQSPLSPGYGADVPWVPSAPQRSWMSRMKVPPWAIVVL